MWTGFVSWYIIININTALNTHLERDANNSHEINSTHLVLNAMECVHLNVDWNM